MSQVLNLLPRRLRRQKTLVTLCRTGIVNPMQIAEFNGNARAWVDLRDAESRAVYLSKSFWPEFPPMVAAFLRNGGNLFDVGANFGLVTFGTLPLIKGTSVRCHLFEANPRIVPLLNRSKALWPGESIQVNHCCVSDRKGITRLTLPDACWGHGYMGDKGEPVSNLVLDDYIDQHQVKKISFMKLDVEGWETRALKGMRRALASGKVEAAFIELDPPSLNRAGTSADELIAQLQDFGFDLYFSGMWDRPDPHRLEWKHVDVNGTLLRFARAVPLPATYRSGDVMAIHQRVPLAGRIRDALTTRYY